MAACVRRSSLLAAAWLLLTTLSPVNAAERVTYYYTDNQGTVLALTDSNGSIVTASDYRPFGTKVLGTPSSGPGYAGHVDEADSGFVYMSARYYDPSVGRFLSVDPNAPTAAQTTSFNRYVYGGNNPSTFVDPDGRQYIPASAYTQNSALSDIEATNHLVGARVGAAVAMICACNPYYQAPLGSGEVQSVSSPLENIAGAGIEAAGSKAVSTIATKLTTTLYRALVLTSFSVRKNGDPSFR